jgi:hypothetical protein
MLRDACGGSGSGSGLLTTERAGSWELRELGAESPLATGY